MPYHIDKYFRLLLMRIFKFDRWHILSLHQRKYAQDIIKFTKQKDFCSIAEIGAGLGDIIRNISSENKLCLDIDKNVLNANRFLASMNNKGCTNINYSQFDLNKDNLPGEYDLIIMVNWLHNIAPATLKEKIQYYITKNLVENGYLIFDILENKEYKYNHDINYLLEELSEIETEVSDKYQFNRRLVYIHKKAY